MLPMSTLKALSASIILPGEKIIRPSLVKYQKMALISFYFSPRQALVLFSIVIIFLISNVPRIALNIHEVIK